MPMPEPFRCLRLGELLGHGVFTHGVLAHGAPGGIRSDERMIACLWTR